MATTQPFPIVAIGASAGGIEALESFFGALPREPGMSFVVVTHLPVGHVSALRDILGRYTQMHVSEIKDGDSLLENHVHVLTEDSVMSVKAGRLRLPARAYSLSSRATCPGAAGWAGRVWALRSLPASSKQTSGRAGSTGRA